MQLTVNNIYKQSWFFPVVIAVFGALVIFLMWKRRQTPKTASMGTSPGTSTGTSSGTAQTNNDLNKLSEQAARQRAETQAYNDNIEAQNNAAIIERNALVAIQQEKEQAKNVAVSLIVSSTALLDSLIAKENRLRVQYAKRLTSETGLTFFAATIINEFRKSVETSGYAKYIYELIPTEKAILRNVLTFINTGTTLF